jgi:chromosome segregation ATPase
MAVSLDFIQSQLKAIQTELREMKFAAEVDRRNAASSYNNLVAEFGAAIGKLDAKVELGFEIVNERIDRLEERIDRLDERVGRLEERIDRLDEGVGRLEERIDRLDEGVGRLEGKMDAGFARIEQLLKRA